MPRGVPTQSAPTATTGSVANVFASTQDSVATGFNLSQQLGLSSAGSARSFGLVGFNSQDQVESGLDYYGALAVTIPAAIAVGGLFAARYVAGEVVGNLSGSAKSAADRAREIHSALDSRAQDMRTTAVTETAQGIRVISSSNPRLSPAQRALLGRNEVEGVGLGHAELTSVNAARNLGLTPRATAASLPICTNCAETLKLQKVEPLTPLK